MILLAGVEDNAYGVFFSHASMATEWLKHMLTHVIHSHHFTISSELGTVRTVRTCNPVVALVKTDGELKMSLSQSQEINKTQLGADMRHLQLLLH